MAIKFYNRKPWNLIIGFGVVATILCLIALLTSFWILLIPPSLIAFFFINYRVTRALHLWSKGYYSGRRSGDIWTYYERHGAVDDSLTLKVEYTEPGHHELFIPKDVEWRFLVPPWAENRREEIALRISEGWKQSDFHYPDDLK